MATFDTGPFPPIPPDANVHDPQVIATLITASFANRKFDPTVPTPADIQYWTSHILAADNNGYSDYWSMRIQTPDGVYGSGNPGSPAQSVPNPSALIAPQLGLLEDDIVYRLSMLAVNVLQPLKNQYPNIVITSGFRQTNSGIGQHELAEAVDLQIRNQTDALLYEVADYIQKTLPFDQLILNFTNIGTGGPWIHVSFSVTSNRGLVLTKDYADTFHDGLFLVTPLDGEAKAAAIREINTETDAITKQLQNIQSRQERLTPSTATIDDLPDGSADNGAPTANPPPGPIACRSDEDFSALSDLDAIDLSVVQYTSRSQAAIAAGMVNWNKTAKMISAEITSAHTVTDYTKAGCWGRLFVLDPTTNTGGTEGNVWVFVQRDGVWYGGVGEWTRPGQIEKGFGQDFSTAGGNMTGVFYDANLDDPLYGYNLQPGEMVGLMVTTPARSGDAVSTSPLQERSNVISSYQP